ncbi:MAG: hypothetical protein IV097_11440 [Burkholderiaceae bacterium]|nr:hypothetical protein [Burkholderiaceae bacterium]
MHSEVVVIDPALLIWNKSDYQVRERDYWRLADDFVSLLDILDELPCKLVLSSPLAELIIEEFPADQLSTSVGLHDFVRLIYTFLSRMLESEEEFPSVALVGFVPDVCSRAHLRPEVSAQLASCLAFAFGSAENGHFASHTVTWNYPARILCNAAYPDKAISVRLNGADYEALRLAFTREYEPHDKHHATCGYGSRLPATLNDSAIQEALDIAIEISGADCLCAKLDPSGVVLVFRRHHQNKYHAYPIEAFEYSKYGIKPDDIPVFVT